jgi:hypothetical protein
MRQQQGYNHIRNGTHTEFHSEMKFGENIARETTDVIKIML